MVFLAAVETDILPQDGPCRSRGLRGDMHVGFVIFEALLRRRRGLCFRIKPLDNINKQHHTCSFGKNYSPFRCERSCRFPYLAPGCIFHGDSNLPLPVTRCRGNMRRALYLI